jgi:cell division protein FtsW
MSEALTLSQRLHTGWAHLTGLFAGDKLSTQDSQAQSLPVNLGGYDFARQTSGSATRLQSVDQALVWVVVALLMWGMVMVLSLIHISEPTRR